jgi:ElaB/YqjD/DUF883 family membrane-anchored ribosome-binding protein
MPDQVQDRDRFDKEKKKHQEQGDAEIQRITVTIDKLKVDLPSDKRGELDNLKQAIQSLVAHYKNQPTQLPADPNQPQAQPK